jgi:hypothetical protein
MVPDAPEALMHPGTSIALIAAMTAGCGPFGATANVRSAIFPWIDIRCEGEAQASGDHCLRWAEQSLAGRLGVAVQSQSLVVAFRHGGNGTWCSASTSFYRPNGDLLLTIGKACPANVDRG